MGHPGVVIHPRCGGREMSGARANIIARGSLRMDLEIRRAQVADAIQIAECLMAAFAPFRHLYTSDAFTDTVPAADALRDRIECMTVYVAVAPVGLVVGTLAAASSGEEGHL